MAHQPAGPPSENNMSSSMSKDKEPLNSDQMQKDKPAPAKTLKEEHAVQSMTTIRNNFYRDNYRRMMKLNLVMISAIIVLLFWVGFQVISQPIPKFYVTTTDGKRIELVPLNQPNLTSAALLQWASEVSSLAYTFNFGNYSQAFQNMRPYFTQAGYTNFLNAIDNSKIINEVTAKQLDVSATKTGSAVILEEGILNNIYVWKIQVPIVLSYQSASDNYRQSLTVTMLIARVPTLESPSGIGIASFVVNSVTS